MKVLLLLFPIVVLGFRGRWLDDCDPLNTSYAIYLIDARIVEGDENCSYEFNLVTGDCAYSSLPFQLNGSEIRCFSDSSFTCNSINTNVLTGYMTKYCGDEITVKEFKPVVKYPLKEEFKIEGANMEANLVVDSACNVENRSEPYDWRSIEVRNCESPVMPTTMGIPAAVGVIGGIIVEEAINKASHNLIKNLRKKLKKWRRK